jgi:hypothetical protein
VGESNGTLNFQQHPTPTPFNAKNPRLFNTSGVKFGEKANIQGKIMFKQTRRSAHPPLQTGNDKLTV